jgi:hypothetical protein
MSQHNSERTKGRVGCVWSLTLMSAHSRVVVLSELDGAVDSGNPLEAVNHHWKVEWLRGKASGRWGMGYGFSPILIYSYPISDVPPLTVMLSHVVVFRLLFPVHYTILSSLLIYSYPISDVPLQPHPTSNASTCVTRWPCSCWAAILCKKTEKPPRRRSPSKQWRHVRGWVGDIGYE